MAYLDNSAATSCQYCTGAQFKRIHHIREGVLNKAQHWLNSRGFLAYVGFGFLPLAQACLIGVGLSIKAQDQPCIEAARVLDCRTWWDFPGSGVKELLASLCELCAGSVLDQCC